MSKNCIYCKRELAEHDVIDVCKSCGVQVWGEKMYDSIVDNMENAREDGNLHQGSVTETSYVKVHCENSTLQCGVSTLSIQKPTNKPLGCGKTQRLFDSETTQTQDQPQVEHLLSEIDHSIPEIEILPTDTNTEDIS